MIGVVVALVVLGAWVVVAVVMAFGARGAARLARVPAPPCFRAPVEVPPGEEARLAFLGDLQRGVADVAIPLARILDEDRAHLLVSSGDFVSHGEAPYYGVTLDAFAAAGIGTPVRVVPGNHDLFPRRVRDASLGGALFEERLGPRHWAVRAGPVLVVGIDDAVAGVGGAQREWLERTLASRGGVPWIAVCHRPPRRLDLPGAPADTGLDAFVALLEADPPSLVVSGHWHEYAEGTVNGVDYVVNAHGGDVHGLGLRRGGFELLRVRARPDGTLEREITRHRRRPWARVLLHQLWVRCWASGRRGAGRWLAAPAAWAWPRDSRAQRGSAGGRARRGT